VDAVAIGCGSGLNCVGRNAAGRIARYPALGWETGDRGGADELGREALYRAARAEDGRGEPTSLSQLVRSHFGRPTAVAVGEDVHYGRLPVSRLGELAPGVVAAAGEGDTVARGLVERLAAEIALLATRALTDLELDEAEVVLGGGMLASGDGLLHELAVAALPEGARPVTPKVAPVAGAVTAMLGDGAAARFRDAFHEWRPDG
jgi:N-acetylglucosamine kinase-like BadF-type ATPase